MSSTSASRSVLVRGGTLVLASGEHQGDVLVEDGTVRGLGGLDEARADEVLDASGCYVAPGLVDLHSHLREPGLEQAETVETGARAGALGGYTALVAMPNTEPAIDSASMVRDVLALGVGAMADIAVAGAITLGRLGERLAPYFEMAELGVRLFTDDGNGVQDPALMRRALEYARDLGVVLAEHCEDARLAAGGSMHEGAWSSRLGIPGQPALAEEAMLSRDLDLVRLTGASMHFLHLSTAGSVELLRRARADQLPVTAEVTPHHLALTDELVESFDPCYKVNPPLRADTDRAALRHAVAERLFDAIATDHAPHPQEAKEAPFEQAPAGMLGLETALSVCFCELVLGEGPDRISFSSLIELMSAAPARISGLARKGQGGPLQVGAAANLVVFDPAEVWTVEAGALASRAKNTPFAGRRLTGKVRHTVHRGEVVVRDGRPQR